MTGYGQGTVPLAGGALVIDVRSVNHRYLDCRVRMPGALVDHAITVEEVIRARLDRGRIEAVARLEGGSGGLPTLDVPRARAAFEQLCALRDELRPGEPVPLSLLSSVPELFTPEGGPAPDEVRHAVVSATEQACAALEQMRAREGVSLAQDLEGLIDRVRGHLDRARVLSPRAVEKHRERLRERLVRLLADSQVSLDPSRLEHEVALFADRSDVAEEIARLGAHCDQFGEMMRGGDGAAGRKLGFLLQEMAREANTLGSKSPDVDLVRLVVDLKSDIERMREQVQNVL